MYLTGDDIERLIIKNDEDSNDYIEIRFKNQNKMGSCTTKQLNSDRRLNSLGIHKYHYDVVQTCYFEPEDTIQFRLETQKARGKADYDMLCLTYVKLILSKVTFIANQRTCTEGTGEWITMKAVPITCG